MRDSLIPIAIGLLLMAFGLMFGADLSALAEMRAEVMVLMGGVTTLFGALQYEIEERDKKIEKLRARLRRLKDEED